MPKLVYHMYAAKDQGSRGEQQDAVNSSYPELQNDLGVLCVLSDGMGGLQGGREAAQAVVETMVSTFHRSSIGDTPEQILLRGCALSQEAVRALQEEPGECGATLTAVLIRENRCSFLSVGDSRIYLYRGGGLIALNRLQNKIARIETQIGLGHLPEAARTDSKRLALTAYIGMKKLEHTDRSSHSFQMGAGDRILLMSDGIYNTLTEDEMLEIAGIPEEAVCSNMVWRTTDKGRPAQDNCSVALVSCTRAEDWV